MPILLAANHLKTGDNQQLQKTPKCVKFSLNAKSSCMETKNVV